MTNQAVTQLAPRASHSADSTNPHRAGNTQDPVQITYAMRLLHAGIDTSVIAVWLGHVSVETTHIYLYEGSGIAPDGRETAGRQVSVPTEQCL